jgi:hypothetical protein
MQGGTACARSAYLQEQGYVAIWGVIHVDVGKGDGRVGVAWGHSGTVWVVVARRQETLIVAINLPVVHVAAPSLLKRHNARWLSDFGSIVDGDYPDVDGLR